MSIDDRLATAHQIAAPTRLDHRTVLAWLEGRPVRRSTRAAIEKAARELGLVHLLPAA